MENLTLSQCIIGTLWCFEQHQEHTEALKKKDQSTSSGSKTQGPNKKAKK